MRREEGFPLLPLPPPALVSLVVADVLGKRDWQIAKLRDGEEKFFKADTNTFEEREVLERNMGMDGSLLGGENTKLCSAHISCVSVTNGTYNSYTKQ